LVRICFLRLWHKNVFLYENVFTIAY
jgi:hypothetical protein